MIMLYIIYTGYALPIVRKENSEIPRSLLLQSQDSARLIISIYN